MTVAKEFSAERERKSGNGKMVQKRKDGTEMKECIEMKVYRNERVEAENDR